MKLHISQGFFRMGGWMLIVSAVIGFVVMILHLEDTPSSLQELEYFVSMAVWTHVSLFMAIALMLIGLAALYVRQGAGIKWWGWLGFVFMFLTFYFDACHAVLQMFDYPIWFDGITDEARLREVSEMVMKVQQGMPGGFFMAISGPFLLLGTLLMGITMWKTNGLTRKPAVASLVLFVAMIGMFVGPEWFAMLVLKAYYLHFAWYGVVLAFEKKGNSLDVLLTNRVAEVSNS